MERSKADVEYLQLYLYVRVGVCSLEDGLCVYFKVFWLIFFDQQSSWRNVIHNIYTNVRFPE